MMINAEQIREIPVFILCGGLGTRIREETEFRPKPMVPIGQHPILWHVMRWYHKFGFRKFVLCLGFRSEVIKHYFLNYHSMNSDCTVDLSTNHVKVHSVDHEQDWEVTLAYTGERAMTGCRVKRAAERYLGDAEYAAVTYGDGLCNADLGREMQFHQEHGRMGTILGIHPPSRFGELKLQDDRVLQFDEKPEFSEKRINGGYFFFRREFFADYLVDTESCVLEREPLARLASDGELHMYRHDGYWACMDTQRDRDMLNEIWKSQQAPWSPDASVYGASDECQAALHELTEAKGRI